MIKTFYETLKYTYIKITYNKVVVEPEFYIGKEIWK